MQTRRSRRLTVRAADASRVPVAASTRTISAAAAAADCIFLTVATALSLVLYIGRLGFYFDDYGLLQRMGTARHGSLLSLYNAVSPGTGQRPVQALTYAVLYWLFGPHPLGWHIFNATVFVAAILLLYLVLRELRQPRLVAVAFPLVYSMLPHYATDRFWAAAFQANTSTAFYLLSLYAALRAVRSRPAAVVGWLAVAVLAIVGSFFAYEVVAPLFVLNLGLIWYAWRHTPKAEPDARRSRLWMVLATEAGAFVAVAAAKTTLVVGGGEGGYRVGFEGGLLHHLAYLVYGVIKLNVGTYLLAIPYVLWWIVRNRFSASTLAVATLSGLFAFGYLLRIGSGETVSVGDERRPWQEIAGVGFVAFVLGYAIFLTNSQILFRSAGIDNRVNAAAALGVAGMLVGLFGWFATRVARRHSVALFAAGIASAVAVGVFVIDSLSSFWTSAYKRQNAIVAGLTHELGSRPEDATVILDGACFELGPAVVFGDQYDLTGALWLRYRDRGLRADVATPDLRATSRGLELTFNFLGKISSRTYPYGRGLIVYNTRNGRLYGLRERQQALKYIASDRPTFSCPPQRGFAWGFHISRWWPFV
jgi:hypothetical protein